MIKYTDVTLYIHYVQGFYIHTTGKLGVYFFTLESTIIFCMPYQTQPTGQKKNRDNTYFLNNSYLLKNEIPVWFLYMKGIYDIFETSYTIIYNAICHHNGLYGLFVPKLVFTLYLVFTY